MEQSARRRRTRRSPAGPCDCHQCRAVDAEAGADLDAQWPGENDLDFTDMDGEYDAEHRTRAGRRAKPSAPCAMQDADADERDEDMAAEDGLVDAASEENESEEDGAGEDDDREESGENAEDEEDLEAEEDFAGASAFEILSDPGEIEEALDDEDSDESEDLEELVYCPTNSWTF